MRGKPEIGVGSGWRTRKMGVGLVFQTFARLAAPGSLVRNIDLCHCHSIRKAVETTTCSHINTSTPTWNSVSLIETGVSMCTGPTSSESSQCAVFPEHLTIKCTQSFSSFGLTRLRTFYQEPCEDCSVRLEMRLGSVEQVAAENECASA